VVDTGCNGLEHSAAIAAGRGSGIGRNDPLLRWFAGLPGI